MTFTFKLERADRDARGSAVVPSRGAGLACWRRNRIGRTTIAPRH
jgi:hypothetical protein